jgi:hypothetical protein
MTGHGNVVFSDAEISNLNKYMVAGGFFTSMIIMEWTNTSEKK